MKNIKTGKDWADFDTQKYPDGKVQDYFLKEIEKQEKLMDKNTKISSIGSCFAVEIANYLYKNEYNYPMMEDDMTQKRTSSADWGAVYNIPCIKQIYKYSFENFNPIVRWWDKGNFWLEPFRRDIAYKKGEEEKRFQTHIKNSYKILSEVDIMILTLGISEVWRDKRDKSTFWRVVPKKDYNPKIHEFHILTIDECINDLNEIKRIIDKYNSKCKLILTVSPVPFFATFRKDIDPVSANFNSKAILKTAVDYFVRNTENTYYFPSFEFSQFGFDDPYGDGRHISKGVVNKTMRLFEKLYVKGK